MTEQTPTALSSELEAGGNSEGEIRMSTNTPKSVVMQPFRWPTPQELEALSPGMDLRQEILADMVRRVTDAFAAGVEYVSVTNGVHEVSRIYRDGRYWSPVS